MKIKATKTFSGKLTMVEGEEIDYYDKVVIKDLLKAGYIEEVKPKKSKDGESDEAKTLEDSESDEIKSSEDGESNETKALEDGESDESQ